MDTQLRMGSQFKIIAIQPLKECARHILKNLNIGEMYYFYDGYTIENDTIRIDSEKILPPKFFTQTKDNKRINSINVSFHAIVGKNGSGKSALIELVMRAINNISYIYFPSEGTGKGGVIPVEKLSVNLFYIIGNAIYKIFLPVLGDNGIIDAKLKKISNNTKHTEISLCQADAKKQLEELFYSIVINYSLYAYNEMDMKSEWSAWPKQGKEQKKRCWIEGICHKNDGYATPIVINPMRKEGNIDVNNEKHLTKSRLLTLLVRLDTDKNNPFRTLNEKNIVQSLIFCREDKKPDKTTENSPEEKNGIKYKLRKYAPSQQVSYKDSETGQGLEKDEDPLDHFKTICKIVFNEWNLKYEFTIKENEDDFDFINNHIAYNYLVYKTISIINTYHNIICPEGCMLYDFTKVNTYSEAEDKYYKSEIENHIEGILKDKSHITLKIRQTINYILHTNKIYDKKHPYNVTVDNFNEALNKTLNKAEKTIHGLLYFMPPPFFDVKIMCTNEEDTKNKKEYGIDELSSGEKQQIYSISTILYHLRNINSTFHEHNGESNSNPSSRIQYKYINLILEEMELYYHPEMQRTMVYDLIQNIQRMDLRNLEAINICMLTHSPIILSDIPLQNILFLEDGKSKKITDLTFGANIHSLYRNSFFMNMPIGKFANEKIINLMSRIAGGVDLQKLPNEIQLIGEPLLKNQLKKLYYEKSDITKRIETLEKELKELKGKLEVSNDKN